MIRIVLITSGLAALAAVALAIAELMPLSASLRPVETAEPWPICTTMETVSASVDGMDIDVDFAAGRRALAAGDWHAAIAVFKLAALRDPENADIHNHIGYAHRRLRQIEPAFDHYRQALVLNPRHPSAHEHLGEAYLVNSDLAKAEEQLAALEAICLLPCAEHADLKTAIALFKERATH